MRTVFKVIAISLILFVAICFCFALRDAKRMARWDWTQSNLRLLAVSIETYKDDHTNYPASMTELIAGLSPRDKADFDGRVLNNKLHDKYDFILLTNGYLVTVIDSESWFIKRERIEKLFGFGEVLK